VPIVLTTHTTREAVLLDALERIGALPQVLAPPKMLRIAPV
jgi:homoserine dehydrogenase